jgi:hypothetical protein
MTLKRRRTHKNLERAHEHAQIYYPYRTETKRPLWGKTSRVNYLG